MMTRDESEASTRQRALVLQGGGALGAYDAGVFQALYENINKKDDSPLFDIVAGTSSGAMNSAILVGNAKEKNWDYAAYRLNKFWNFVSRDENGKKIGIERGGLVLLTEDARRYYSAKQFLCSGVPHVFSPLFSTPCLPFIGPARFDTRFFDNVVLPNNIWYTYSNQPLKASLEKFINFPIKTSYKSNQPRLLIVSVDVQEGAVVTFDSYAKDVNDTIRESTYGDFIRPPGEQSDGDQSKGHYKYAISYPDGIEPQYVMASGSVPINYDYTEINGINELQTLDDQGNATFNKVSRYFWDGGILSNTPLRELIQAHKDYWFTVKGKEQETAIVPDLDVYIVDVWPTKEKGIPWDHDGVSDRKEDLLLNDKTDYDKKVADMVSDYIDFAKRLKDLAVEATNAVADVNKKKKLEKNLKDILKTKGKSSHRTDGHRNYQDLLNGRFDINVITIERTNNVYYDISNKMFDYSSDTIKQLMDDGRDDALKIIR
jgi:NTE family protein